MSTQNIDTVRLILQGAQAGIGGADLGSVIDAGLEAGFSTPR